MDSQRNQEAKGLKKIGVPGYRILLALHKARSAPSKTVVGADGETIQNALVRVDKTLVCSLVDTN
jgi:hypothetical protein